MLIVLFAGVGLFGVIKESQKLTKTTQLDSPVISKLGEDGLTCPVDISIGEYDEFLVTLGENTILVKPEEVVINEGFEESDVNEFVVKKIDYPNLFDLKDKYSRIHVTEVVNSFENDNGLIYISNQRPDHGSINDGYFIKIDPKLKKVVDQGWKRLFGSVRLYSSSNGSALPLIEFKQYNPQKGIYELDNSNHKTEFIKLKVELLAINKKEICKINGRDLTLEEAVGSAGETDKCADWLLGASNETPAVDFITIGQYRQILKNVQRIIDGGNIKVFEII